MLALQPEERVAEILDITDYDQADYLVLATKRGLVKKTRLSDYDSARTGGVIAINLRDNGEGPDEVVAARLVNAGDDLLLVSRKGQSLRFTASDEALRPTGRATSGVTGMKFRGDDSLLSMDVVRDEGDDLFVVTEGGFGKRTAVSEYRRQGRGGLGIKVANLVEERGDLVGALITDDDDEVLLIMERGKIVRSAVNEVTRTGRTTQGVTFAKPDPGDRIIGLARNLELRADVGEAEGEDDDDGEAQEEESMPASDDGVTSSQDRAAGGAASASDNPDEGH